MLSTASASAIIVLRPQAPVGGGLADVLVYAYSTAMRTSAPAMPDFWMPLAAEPATHGKNSLLGHKTNHWLYVFGRSKPAIQLGSVEAKLNTELQQWMLENEPPANQRDRQNLEKQRISIAPGGGGIAGMKETYERDLRLLIVFWR